LFFDSASTKRSNCMEITPIFAVVSRDLLDYAAIKRLHQTASKVQILGSFSMSHSEPLRNRLVRYAELRPCTTAFIDAKSPGSDRKENFTIIGPGVAENPDQHVHIREPHGFNIGGARQPPRCTNSQHSHETAEVFVVHSGRWAFRTGEFAKDGEIILEPGDVISIPTQVFRGFENVGEDSGFLFAVLGEDDPGRVTWAPHVLEKAKGHGLVLMENGALVDTAKGQTPPPGVAPMPTATVEELAAIRRFNDDDLGAIVVRAGDSAPSPDTPLAALGVAEHPIIGAGSPAEPMPAGPLNWPHGFNLRRLTLAPGASTPLHVRQEAEVVFVQSGTVEITCDGEILTLGAGDTFTTPIGAARKFASAAGADLYVVRGGDEPAAPRVLETVEASQA
jgi:mannose-6-phosphate isomerase-like protein (cupin superfamily)